MEKLAETVSDMNQYYHEKVKPSFQSGNLPQAKRCLTNLIIGLQFTGTSLFPYHSALNCISRAELMQDYLREGKMPSKELLIEFEAYLAQTKLSTISGNAG